MLNVIGITTMKILTFVCLTFLSLFLPSVAFAKTDILLSTADFKTVDGQCQVDGALSPDSWGATTQGGNYGSRQADSCVVWQSGSDSDNVAYITLDTPQGAAKRMEIEHLDGIANASFTVEVQHANKKWIQVFSYTDEVSTNDPEKWHTAHIDLTNITLGRGRYIPIRLTATGDAWVSRPTWGQLAIDSISLYGNGKGK